MLPRRFDHPESLEHIAVGACVAGIAVRVATPSAILVGVAGLIVDPAVLIESHVLACRTLRRVVEAVRLSLQLGAALLGLLLVALFGTVAVSADRRTRLNGVQYEESTEADIGCFAVLGW